MKHQQSHQPQGSPKQTLGRRAEAVAVFCLLAFVGALGLHAATQTTSFDPVAATVGNARLLSVAIVQYEQDNDERLPNTQSIAAFQAGLRPFVVDAEVFNSRVTGKPFVPNPAISGRSLSEFNDPGTVEAFRDTVPPSRTPATVGFLDNHIERGVVVIYPTQSSYANARALSQSVIQYTQDYDEIYPPMKTQSAFQAAVRPYVGNSRVFVDPANGKPFVPNPALSQVSSASIADPAHTVVFQTDKPYKNGVPTVAYADGRITPPPPPSPFSLSVQDNINLRQIGQAILQYSQDYDEKLPTTTDYTTFTNELVPYTYTRTTSIFTSPASGLPYVLNPAVSNANPYSFDDPDNTEIARDAQLNPDGTFNHLEVDGRVKQDFYFVPQSLLVTPDDRTHLLWHSASRQASLWTFQPSGEIIKTLVTPDSGVSAFSVGADGQIHLLGGFGYGGGVSSVNSDGTLDNPVGYGIYDGWSVTKMATGPDNETRLLWQRTSGPLALWTLSPANDFAGYVFVPRLTGGTTVGMGIGSDGLVRLLWKTATGDAVLWTISNGGQVVRRFVFTSPSGQTPAALAIGPDGSGRLLFSGGGSDHAAVRTVTGSGKSGSPVTLTLPGGGTAVQLAVGKNGDLRVLWSAGTNSQLQTLTPQGSQTGVLSLTPYL